jgi:hypothetical protein
MITRVAYSHSEPYSAAGFRPDLRPYLAVQIQAGALHVDTMGIVDSGADLTLFNEQLLEPLGLDKSQAVRIVEVGAAGRGELAFCFDVILRIKGGSFSDQIGFTPAADPAYGWLGRPGLFMACAIGFDERRARFLYHFLPPAATVAL